MLPEAKLPGALHAIHCILVVSRMLAHEEAPHRLLAEIIDASEYLVQLLGKKDDCTLLFRQWLLVLEQLDPRFHRATELYDDQTALPFA